MSSGVSDAATRNRCVPLRLREDQTLFQKHCRLNLQEMLLSLALLFDPCWDELHPEIANKAINTIAKIPTPELRTVGFFIKFLLYVWFIISFTIKLVQA